jgi:hypothetical protein
MKRALIIILTVVLFLSGIHAAAEIPESEYAGSILRYAVEMTAQMASDAAAGAYGAQRQADWANQLADVAFASPVKAVVIKLDTAQTEALAAGLNTDEENCLGALSLQINSEYSADFAAVADGLALEWDSYNLVDQNTLVLLIYESELSLSFLRTNLQAQSVFLIGDASVPEQIDGGYVEGYLESLGIPGAAYHIYSADAIPRLLPLNYSTEIEDWTRLETAVLSSTNSFARLLPELFQCGIFNADSTGYDLAASYLDANAEPLSQALAASKFISETIDPIVSPYYLETGREERWMLIYRFEPGSGCSVAGLLPAFSDEQAAQAYDPAGTVLAVWDYRKGDTNPQTIFMPMLESALPAARIPSGLEDTDYILLVSTDWDDVYKATDSVTLYNAGTTAALYDAKTGFLIQILGETTNVPSGLITYYGNAYYTPVDFNTIWNLMAAISD